MKILTTLLLTVSILYTAQATIHTVNSDPNFDADFTNLATAITTASVGDTIQVYGSSSSYGTTTIDKQLFIYGPGYFLNDNPIPTQQTYTESATLGSTTIQSTATGLQIQGIYVNGTLKVLADDVIIENCRVNSAQLGEPFGGVVAVDNITYRENYSGTVTMYDGSSNITITNNYLSGTVSTSTIATYNYTGILIKNNVFIGQFVTCCNAENAVIENNIAAYFNTSSSGGTFLNNAGTYGITYSNNLGTHPSSLTGNGNQAGVALTDMSGNILFEGYPTGNGFSFDGAYQLISVFQVSQKIFRIFTNSISQALLLRYSMSTLKQKVIIN